MLVVVVQSEIPFTNGSSLANRAARIDGRVASKNKAATNKMRIDGQFTKRLSAIIGQHGESNARGRAAEGRNQEHTHRSGLERVILK